MQRLNTLNILTLTLAPGIGKNTFQRILNALSFNPSNLKELYEVASSVIKLTYSQLESAFTRAEQVLEEHEKAGIKVIGIHDTQFPQKLRTIVNCPPVIYIKGDINCLNPEYSVAVIGTRQPTNYGKKVGEGICQKIVKEFGLTIVSGLAIGCDTAAHEGCLQAEGRTVAVLAHGLHRIYPAENRDLARRILDCGGCLVSEYPLGQEIFKNQFVERDRIQSGLSSAVIVIETDIKSGTMHTVNFCIEQGRKLACINYPLEHRSDKSRGNEKLIYEEKAIPLWENEEIEKFVFSTFGQVIEQSRYSTLLKSDSVPEETSIIKTTFNPVEELIIEKKVHIQNEVFSEKSILPPINNVNKSDAYIEFKIKINKEEYRIFELKCSANQENPHQVIHKLLKQYSSDDTGENTISKTKKGNRDLQGSYHKQLSIIPHLDVDIMDESIITNLEDIKTLSQEDLAKRLKVALSTIRKNKQKGSENFKTWSRSKDPKGIAWEYSEKNKRFEIAF